MPFHPLWEKPLALPQLQGRVPQQPVQEPQLLALPLQGLGQELPQGLGLLQALPPLQEPVHQALRVQALPQQEPVPLQALPPLQEQVHQALRVQALPLQEPVPLPVLAQGLPPVQGSLPEQLQLRQLVLVLLRVGEQLLRAVVAVRPLEAEVEVEQQL